MGHSLSSKVSERLRHIKLLLLDVDGILTDNRVFLDSNGEWKRFFSIRDGYGIKLMMASGYQAGVITGSKTRDIQERVKALGLQYFIEGTLDKKPAFDEILSRSGFKPEEVAYMGDDEFDLPVLRAAGFSATAPDAMDEVLESVHYTTVRPAGNGAVREVCDLIVKFGAFSRGQK